MAKRQWYITDCGYQARGDSPLDQSALLQAARIAAQVVGAQATRLEGDLEGSSRAGVLPPDREGRHALIDWIFDRFDEHCQRGGARFLRLVLRRGKSTLISLAGNLPADGLFMTPEEADEVTARLRAAGLPSDLFFPLKERRTRRVTVTDHRGRASWRFEHFSPRQWRLSQPSTPLPPIPTHQVRRQAFAVQCREFLDELHYQELRALQGMRGSRRDEVQAIRDLERHVRSVMENMQTGRTEVFRDRATAGWRQTPTAWQALDSVADALLHLHPDCFIGELWGTSEEPDHWYMYIDPDDGSHYEFWIRRGVLYGPVEGPSTSPPLRDPRKVFSARERGWWSFTDSDVAVSRANQAGGFAYLKRGGRIGLLQMRYERDHLVWVVPYERFSRAYSYRLRVFVDMASGEVVSTQKDRFLNLP